MRKRRKQRFTWFPILPSANGDEPETEFLTFFEEGFPLGGSLVTPNWNISQAVATAVVADFDNDDLSGAQDVSLRDRVEGKDWLCKRVVGKVWGGWPQTGTGTVTGAQFPFGILAMGLAVLPVDPLTGAPAIPNKEFNPLEAGNSAQPWLWRRTWRLMDDQQVTRFQNIAGNPSPTRWPVNTEVFGSMVDGGHLDTRGVSRRIRREERLFFCVSAAGQTLDATPIGATTFPVYGYDLRVLGAMRRANNRSVF